MNRIIASCCAFACALVLPAAASATVSGSSTGTITTISGMSLTIQTAGPRTGVVNALTTAANRVTKDDYPYVYGGGHPQAGIASIGIKGPGYNGHRVGYDCSGSVGAVLAGAGLWPAGGGVPNDAGIITELLGERLIARGVGTGPMEVTLYDDPGVHIFMNIDGRFFGTSDGGGGGNPRGGAGWLDDGAPDASSRTFKPFHFLPSALRASASTGHIVSFQLNQVESLIGGLQVGEQVKVSYQEARSGSLIATAIAYPGSITVSGIVGSIADDWSSFTIQTAGGTSLTFSTGTATELVDGLEVGDTVQVTYTKSGSTLTARAVTATPAAGTGTTGTTGPTGPSGGGPSGGGWGGGGS